MVASSTSLPFGGGSVVMLALFGGQAVHSIRDRRINRTETLLAGISEWTLISMTMIIKSFLLHDEARELCCGARQ